MFWIVHYLGLSTLFRFFFGNNKPIAEPDKNTCEEIECSLEVVTFAVTDDRLAGGSDADEPFPLLELPPELILSILRFLPHADRLRARVNLALYHLEAGEEYWARKMVIARSQGPGNHFFHDEDIPVKLRGPRARFVPCLAKLASNVSMDSLKFRCEHPVDFVLIPHVKSMRADRLILSFCDHSQPSFIYDPQNPGLGTQEMTDATLEEWIGDSKFLNVHGFVGLTGERIFQLYNDMANHRSSLLSLQLFEAPPAESRKVLQLLGITYVEGRIHSSRKDIEVYLEHLSRASSMAYGHFLIILGSKMKISINNMSLDFPSWSIPTAFTLERHNEDGSVPEQWEANYSFYLSIQEIRRQTKRFGRVPVIYSN